MVARPPASRSAFLAQRSAIGVEEDTRRDRLAQAAAQLLSEQGIAGASARAVAAAAGVAPSAINYNFGNLEHLLSIAFEHGATQTVPWLEARSRELQALPAVRNSAALALVHVISAWTRDARPLALLYQEQLAAGGAADWTRLWRGFWQDAAAMFGLSAIEGRLLHVLFESEALYNLSTWSPALEAAAFVETCDHFAAIWLGATPRADRGALAWTERTAGAKAHGSIVAPAALRIAEAAAEVVEDRGLGGLTHRAVAAKAGVTTGSVTHHFRSIEDLVAGAIRGQVQVLTPDVVTRGGVGIPNDEILTVEGLFEAIRFHALAESPSNPVTRRRRLFLASVRREDLAGAGAVIRYSQGGTVRDSLAKLFALSHETLVLHSATLSRLLSAIWFASEADAAPEEARRDLLDQIEERFLAFLDRSA